MSAQPKTLMDGHAVAVARRPAENAKLSAWLSYHQSNARMYRYLSDVDRGHHHELMYWVNYEERKAAEVTRQIEEQSAQAK